MIWRWQSSVWVAQCHSTCLSCLSFPSLSADPIHFLLFAIQTVNTLMSLLFLYGTFVHDISVLPTSANATEYKPKKFLWYWPYLFIYILLGKGKSILSAVYCVVCKYGLPHSQHNLKDDSHEMSLTLPHVATWNLLQEKDFCLPILFWLWTGMYTFQKQL